MATNLTADKISAIPACHSFNEINGENREKQDKAEVDRKCKEWEIHWTKKQSPDFLGTVNVDAMDEEDTEAVVTEYFKEL